MSNCSGKIINSGENEAMIPFEALEKVDRALLKAAAACDAPLPFDEESRQEIRRRTMEILRIRDEWVPEIRMELIKSFDFPQYRIETLKFESWQGFCGKATLYMPHGVEKPPVILFNHGHAMKEGRLAESYQKFGELLASHKVAMLVADVTGAGERGNTGHKGSFDVFSCGTTVCGIIVLEAMGMAHYIRNCGRFDEKRIGIAGQSGGGQTTLFLSALIPDLAALFAPCGFVHSFEYNARKGRRLCECDIFPGVVGELEMYHMLGCVAPKPLLTASGLGDPMIARDVVVNMAHRMRCIYRHYGAAENYEHLHWRGGHSLATSAESLCGVANFILRNFKLPEIPEGEEMPGAVLDIPKTADELLPGEIDINTVAERLTGKSRQKWSSIAESFPPRLIEDGIELDAFWRELLAQMESFISPRFRF